MVFLHTHRQIMSAPERTGLDSAALEVCSKVWLAADLWISRRHRNAARRLERELLKLRARVHALETTIAQERARAVGEANRRVALCAAARSLSDDARVLMRLLHIR